MGWKRGRGDACVCGTHHINGLEEWKRGCMCFWHTSHPWARRGEEGMHVFVAPITSLGWKRGKGEACVSGTHHIHGLEEGKRGLTSLWNTSHLWVERGEGGRHVFVTHITSMHVLEEGKRGCMCLWHTSHPFAFAVRWEDGTHVFWHTSHPCMCLKRGRCDACVCGTHHIHLM